MTAINTNHANKPIYPRPRQVASNQEKATENPGIAADSYEPGELLVRLKSDMASAAPIELPGAIVEEFHNLESDQKGLAPTDRIVRIKLDEGVEVEDAAKSLGRDPGIAWAEPNYTWSLEANIGTNDKFGSKLWGMKEINAPQAWKTTTGSREGAVVAVLDSGIDQKHPDLVNNLWTNPGEIPGNGIDDDGNGVVDDVHGYNALDQNGNPHDELKHGTHVAGTIGAEGNNGIGVAGVNWQTRIMPVKIFGGNGKTNSAAILRGIEYAKKMGADITNNSWGGTQYSNAIQDAFAANPALHVCAAGNSSNDNDAMNHYPSGYELPNLISVAAISEMGRLASYSNYGATTVDIAAPGSNIVSTIPTNRSGRGRYQAMNGTSMASPHVAGAAVLVKSQFPKASAAEVKEILMDSAQPRTALKGKVATGGVLDVEKAIQGKQ